jgi:transcriptional regulator with XRE-family HTH domain
METLGERLKILRGTRSQAEIASILGIKQQTYAAYENARCEPDVGKIIKLSQLNGVTTDWLLGKSDTKTEQQIPAGSAPTGLPSITAEDLSNLIRQNRALSNAAEALGEAQKILAASNADLAAANKKLADDLIKITEETRSLKDCTPVHNAPAGGRRATKTA